MIVATTMSSPLTPLEYTGNPEDFLSRRYRGHHIPVTDAEKLWADTARLQDDLDIFDQDLLSTKKVLNRLLNYERVIKKLEEETPEPPPAPVAATPDATNESASHDTYVKLAVLLNELTSRVNFYERDCVDRMIDFLILSREYKPVLAKSQLAVREDAPSTEAQRLRFRILDLLEQFTHEKRRLKELRGFIKDDLNFKGFDQKK